MQLEPFDVTYCHSQEDIGIESVNIRALYWCTMPDRSPIITTNHQWLV